MLRSFFANHNAGVSASATAERETGVTGDVREREKEVAGREAGVLDDVEK